MKLWALALALLCSTSLYAQTAKPAPSAKSPATIEQEKRLQNQLEQGLMGALKKNCTGLPVVATKPSHGDAYAVPGDKPLPGKTLDRLQLIAEQNSLLGDPLIPYRIRKSWAIAPELRDEVRTDYSAVAQLDILDRATLLELLLGQMTPDQIKGLGEPEGLAISELNAKAKQITSALLVPPLSLVDETVIDFPAKDDESVSFVKQDIRQEISRPIDLSAVRLRAALRVNDFYYEYAEGRVRTLFVPQPTADTNVLLDTKREASTEYLRVVNAFKPCDLDGRLLVQPIGVSGVMTIDALLKQASKVTGLKIRPTGSIGKHPVFVGVDTMPVGDVLDGMRLSIASTFRLLGDTYLLCWDKRGMAGLSTLIDESYDRRLLHTGSFTVTGEPEPPWETIARTLPFAPDDPLAWTDVQRENLYANAEEPRSERYRAGKGLRFQEMTAVQQRAVSKAVLNETISLSKEDGGPRKGTMEDVQRCCISGNAFITVMFSIPGNGWVRYGRLWESPVVRISRVLLSRKLASMRENKEPFVEPGVLEQLKNREPVALDAPLRGFIVPPLFPSRLASLAKEMSNRGLNTLFYPALYNGYATFPSKVFPVYPALNNTDGFANAVAIMRRAGIKVIPYLNTLTWQNLGSNNHWMNKHKDWWDVDPLGRTALEFAKARPLSEFVGPFSGCVNANWVRASEPAVATKLQTLVDELTERKDISGIAFLDWTSRSQTPFYWTELNLGYSEPDRLNAYRKTGDDPLDDGFQDSPEAYLYMNWDEPSKVVAPPEWTLMKGLLDRVKAKQKTWQTYLQESAVDPSEPELGRLDAKPPVADVTLCLPFTDEAGDSQKTAMVLPITSENYYTVEVKTEVESGYQDDIPEDILKVFDETPAIIAYKGLAVELEQALFGKHPGGILLDFRSAPEQITESLPYIAKAKPAAMKSDPAKEKPE